MFQPGHFTEYGHRSGSVRGVEGDADDFTKWSGRNLNRAGSMRSVVCGEKVGSFIGNGVACDTQKEVGVRNDVG